MYKIIIYITYIILYIVCVCVYNIHGTILHINVTFFVTYDMYFQDSCLGFKKQSLSIKLAKAKIRFN